jgi:anti-sigma factor ChrR (cupin superfamily)
VPFNHELARRAVVVADAVEWVARGPLHEKVLEDDDGMRRTAIVRLPPGVRLPAIADGNAFDIVVLDGQMHDGDRVYPHGWYVRTPGPITSIIGCTLFVKLRPLQRSTRHAIDLANVALEPAKTDAGVASCRLHEDDDGAVALFRIAPRGRIKRHRHERCEEIFVLDGDVVDEFGRYQTNTWVRQPPDSTHSVTSREGCTFLVFADSVEVAPIEEPPPPVGRPMNELLCAGARPWPEALALVAAICAEVPNARAQRRIDLVCDPPRIYVDATDDGLIVTLVAPPVELTPNKWGHQAEYEYMAPERIMGKPLTPATLVYTFGVIAYELITGRRPFPDARGPAGLITAILKQVPPPPSTVVAGLPPAVDALVMGCLARDPAVRCADPADLLAAIDALTSTVAAGVN